MGRVLLIPPAYQGDHLDGDYETVLWAASASRSEHELVHDPSRADVLLFVGSRDRLYADVRQHPYALQYPRKVVVYDSSDWFIPLLPGIYPSLMRRLRLGRSILGGHYLRWSKASEITEAQAELEGGPYLFGFTGDASNHPLRRQILRLQDDRANIRDTRSELGRAEGQVEAVYSSYKRRYANDLRSAKFILCPRGMGSGSIRLYEAMRAGRVPVIISDGWVPPLGPNWSAFSIRVREASVENLPRLLRAREGDAARMGRVARDQWNMWFAPDRAFDVLGTWALRAGARRRRVELTSQVRALLGLLSPNGYRWVVRPWLRRGLRLH